MKPKSLISLLKVWKPSTNPLPEILEVIPYGDSVLDLDLCDKIRKLLIIGNPKLNVDNAMIKTLVYSLMQEGLVSVVEVGYPSAHGKVLFIKRNING